MRIAQSRTDTSIFDKIGTKGEMKTTITETRESFLLIKPPQNKETSLEHSNARHIHWVERTDYTCHLSSHRTTKSWTAALVEVAFRNYRNSQKMLKMNTYLGIEGDTTKWSKGFESRHSRRHSIVTHKTPVWELLWTERSSRIKPQHQVDVNFFRPLDSTWSQIMLACYRAKRWIDPVMCCVQKATRYSPHSVGT